jgi:charged multivesicular body protein 4A/B
MLEDIAENQEVTNEITQAISNPSGLQNDIDDDELLKELEEMQEVRFLILGDFSSIE